MADHIFVFGSNLAGIHGRGSAYEARKHFGALQGVGVGRQGMSYAIPTKNRYIQRLPLAQINEHVATFLTYAREHAELTFDVVEIGCGLAGYLPQDIAPMFQGAPSNVRLPQRFLEELAALPGGFRTTTFKVISE